MDWSEKIACIKCDGDKNLLVCYENDCPLAIHKECLGCPARLDHAGHFYCPYCWYKKAVAELPLAREYALSRKKALLIFMDEGVTCGEKHLDENKRAEDNVCNVLDISAGTAKVMKGDDGISRQNVDDVLGQPIICDDKIILGKESEAFEPFNGQNPASEIHEEENIRDAEEKKNPASVMHEEENTRDAEEKKNPASEMHEEENTRDAEEKKLEEFETSAVAEAQDLSLKIHREQKITHTEEKMIQEKEHEINAASADHDSSVMVQEEEHNLQEVYNRLSASPSEEPSQTVPAGSGRGLKRSSSVDNPSETIKPKFKRSAVTPVRRSSRRLSSTPQK